jgi:hypothetical protein
MANLNKADRLYEDAILEERKWLEGKGWKYTSSNPACLWLYEKRLADERLVIVDARTARAFEGR